MENYFFRIFQPRPHSKDHLPLIVKKCAGVEANNNNNNNNNNNKNNNENKNNNNNNNNNNINTT